MMLLVVLSTVVQQKNFVLSLLGFASILSSLEGSHVGPLFTNQEQKKRFALDVIYTEVLS